MSPKPLHVDGGLTILNPTAAQRREAEEGPRAPLRKTAAEREDLLDQPALQGAGALTAGALGSVGAEAVHGRFLRGVQDAGEQSLLQPGHAELVDAIKAKAPHPTFHAPDWLERASGSKGHNGIFIDEFAADKLHAAHPEVALHPKAHFVVGEQGKVAPFIMAHEYGHSQGGVSSHAISAANHMHGLASIGGLAAGAFMDDPLLGLGLATAVPAALHAPQLLDEGLASLRGYRALRSSGADKAALQTARRGLGNAFGTYASTAADSAFGGAQGWGLGRLGRSVFHHEGSEKTSSVTELQDALEKFAKTRSVTEWQKAKAEGRAADADAIAHAADKLELKPRYLKDISTGGEEAAVDLMMGVPQHNGKAHHLPDGYVARKLYKKDSPIHQGDVTDKVLQMKQQYTDEMRALPKGKEHVLDMAGHQRLGPDKFVSFHEYAPNFREPGMRDMPSLLDMKRKVIDPMDAKGHNIVDAIQDGFLGPAFNPGNIAMVPQPDGSEVPRIMDFIPMPNGDQGGPIGEFIRANGIGPEATRKPVNEVRKDVFGGIRQPGQVADAVADAGASGADDAIGLLGRAKRFALKHPVGTAVGAGLGLATAGYGAHKYLQHQRSEAAQEKSAGIDYGTFSACIEESMLLVGV